MSIHTRQWCISPLHGQQVVAVHGHGRANISYAGACLLNFLKQLIPAELYSEESTRIGLVRNWN